MWRVSDKVSPGVITAVTQNCERTDCVLSARGIGETTTKGISDYYNKHGQLIISDTNNFTAEVLCGRCGQAFMVTQKASAVTVEDVTEAYKAKTLAWQKERRGY